MDSEEREYLAMANARISGSAPWTAKTSDCVRAPAGRKDSLDMRIVSRTEYVMGLTRAAGFAPLEFPQRLHPSPLFPILPSKVEGSRSLRKTVGTQEGWAHHPEAGLRTDGISCERATRQGRAERQSRSFWCGSFWCVRRTSLGLCRRD